MARKRLERPDEESRGNSAEVQQHFAARLAQHGEAFMQMFEDAGTMPPPPKRVAVSTCEAEPSASDSDTSLEKEADTNAALTDTFTDVWHDQSKSRHRNGASSQSSRLDNLKSKAERRRFMSGKAADVHHKTVPDLQPQKPRHRQQQAGRQVANSATNEPLSRDDFLNMQREVQQVGASALDRKARRKFDAWQLQSVNAAPQKPGRLSAAIGKGMAKKQAARDQKAHEEAIASGLIKLKGSGKKRATPGSIEKGLLEDGGAFKAGMLRVKGPTSKGAKFKKPPSNTKRAFSSGKIGDLNSNSQKAWVKAQQSTSRPTSKRPRR